MVPPVTIDFTKKLPKIETCRLMTIAKAKLHAHLSGSISRQCLYELWEMERARYQKESLELDLENPLIAMPIEKVDWDVETFFPLFTEYIYNLITSPETIIYSTTSVLESFRADGIAYLELRTTPRKSPNVSKEDYICLVQDSIERFTHSSSTFSTAPHKMSTYLILSIQRSDTASQAMETVDLAIKYKHRGIIVGVDICGNPMKGDVSIYKDAFAKARQNGLKITLHFAEVPASSTVVELETLLAYKPDRLGHVIHVPNATKEEIISRKLGLELCLTCNINAKFTSGGYAEHHFKYWRGTGCPIILCTDDVGIFSSHLSNEYLLAAKHFDLDRKDLLELCKGAIEAIFGGEEEKKRLRFEVERMEKEEEVEEGEG